MNFLTPTCALRTLNFPGKYTVKGSIVKKQARKTAKMSDHGNKCYVPGCAGDVMSRDGLVSVFRKSRKANTAL